MLAAQGEDSKQKTTKETKALSSAAAKTFVLFAAFCKKSKPYPPESSLPSPAQLARRGGRKPSEFPSVKNPNFSRKRSQNFTQYISEGQKGLLNDEKSRKAKTRER